MVYNHIDKTTSRDGCSGNKNIALVVISRYIHNETKMPRSHYM